MWVLVGVGIDKMDGAFRHHVGADWRPVHQIIGGFDAEEEAVHARQAEVEQPVRRMVALSRELSSINNDRGCLGGMTDCVGRHYCGWWRCQLQDHGVEKFVVVI